MSIAQRIADVLESLQSSLNFEFPATRVHGGTTPSYALLLARACAETQRTFVVLCKDDDTAAVFAQDLETLLSATQTAEALVQVHHFPTWEQSPYSPIAPAIRPRLARLGVLHSLCAAHALVGSPSVILVTTRAAISQGTLPKSFFEKYSLPFTRGDVVGTREGVIERLLDRGYLRVDPVEDPGTFSVRGDILDVFSPHAPKPFRIELFDDEVERIREFDPASQRTLPDELSSIILCPAREVLINAETTPRCRERVKERADNLGVPRSVRDPILSGVQPGHYPDHSDVWAPFAYENPGKLWDYLPSNAVWAWLDELSVQQAWDDFAKDERVQSETAHTAQVIAPPFHQLFGDPIETDQILRQKSVLYLDRLALTDVAITNERSSPKSHHRIAVNQNHDLRSSKDPSGFAGAEEKLKGYQSQKYKILIFSNTASQKERIRYLLENRGLVCQNSLPAIPGQITLLSGVLSEGLRWPSEGWIIITEEELLGSSHVKRVRRESKSESASAAKSWSGLQALSDLSVGDGIVHVDHGIGRYAGLVRLNANGAASDFLQVEYANKDRLYLPVYRLNVVQKYAGVASEAALDRLGSQNFAKAKEKVRDSVKKLAIDLIQLYAQRKVLPGPRFGPADALYREFESKFPFDETPDQLKAIDAVLEDFETGRAMDRLVCGDVGYGKTEVAIRAAFRAITEGYQVAILVPTTVLAFQHEQSFLARMKDYPFRIASISRFKSAQEQKVTLAGMASGSVDIVIGTHRLFSKDVRFKNLGLIIIDEEHRFGVEHKEKLKEMKKDAHVLALTATPIPRTLHMSLSGLRDISLINTPPIDRLPIRTYVSRFDEDMMTKAIQFELQRGGQVFFLHNRVDTIYEMANRIRVLCPQAIIQVAHGQMNEKALEAAMIQFYEKQANVLLCTTIIESGIDLPTANTIIINRADMLGLSQLYQIRGRVGRGQQRAYAYLMVPAEGAMSEDAKKRLEVLQRFVELGSGFSIASHDLEIRGGGDLLGPQQSGHIAAVGFELYTELLEEAIHALQGKAPESGSQAQEPEIKVPYPAFLPDDYVPDVHQRLTFYRRLSGAPGESSLIELEQELRDRFGDLPAEGQNLIWLIRIKLLLKAHGITSLTLGAEKLSLSPSAQSSIDPVKVIARVSAQPNQYQLTPDSRLIIRMSVDSLSGLLFKLEELLRGFASVLPQGVSNSRH